MYSVTKDFKFEAAHRLAKGYTGKCANIHGHSWKGHITLEIEELDDKDFSIDFSEMSVFCKAIENNFDHKLILCREDEHTLAVGIMRAIGNNGSILLMDQNPTCEALCKEIFDRAVDFFYSLPIDLAQRITIKSVTIEETCTTSCTYSPSPAPNSFKWEFESSKEWEEFLKALKPKD